MNRDIIEDDIQDEINNEIISEEEIKVKGKQISRQVIEDEINKERKHGRDNNESEEVMSKRIGVKEKEDRREVKEKEDGREDDIQTLLQLFNDLGIREERNNKEIEKISQEEEGTSAISNTKEMKDRKEKMGGTHKQVKRV